MRSNKQFKKTFNQQHSFNKTSIVVTLENASHINSFKLLIQVLIPKHTKVTITSSDFLLQDSKQYTKRPCINGAPKHL